MSFHLLFTDDKKKRKNAPDPVFTSTFTTSMHHVEATTP